MKDFLKNASAEVVNQITEDSIQVAIKRTKVAITNLSVQVADKVATVKGEVNSDDDKRKVIEVVKGVKGISKVKHGIKVAGKEEAGEEDSEGIDNNVEAVYIVRAGDSLWAIAEKFYGDGTKWEKISEANQLMEKRGRNDLIHPGDELTIPAL
ncbi:MAG: LysM peptidoglycan-binding domain-containing protein [Thermonemataceae bacterium]